LKQENRSHARLRVNSVMSMLPASVSKSLTDLSPMPDPRLKSDNLGCLGHFGKHTSLPVFATGINALRKEIRGLI
jgi:hypothetical protein